jgi:hypothetical protein
MKGRTIIDTIAFRIFAAVGCGGLAIATLFFSSSREPPWLVFSAVESPDSTFVAENAMANSDNGIGRVSVRRLILWRAVS